MNWRQLLDAFARWRKQGKPLVLATVVHTAGSTYAKAGTCMLIDPAGDYSGLLSGGCLEPDLAAHAREVAASGRARIVTYDMREREADELWGLGLGCDGMMQVLVQALDAHDDYRPLGAVANAIRQDERGTLVLECAPRPGAAALVGAQRCLDLGLGAALSGQVAGIARTSRQTHRATLPAIDGPHELLFVPLALPLRLLLLGAGPDAVPVLRFAGELGWSVTLADHRPAYLERSEFAVADARHAIDPDRLGTTLLAAQRFDAAVIMSHHLATDRAYLQALSATEIDYIGLLGPPARKSALMQDIGAADGFVQRVHGPIGLDIGARGPEAIALAIVAQIHEQLRRVPD